MCQNHSCSWHRPLGFVLAGLLFFGGCGGERSQGPMTEAGLWEFWSQLSSYEATIQITFFTNQTGNTYTVRQQALSSGPYRMEIVAPESVKGVLTLFDGEKTIQEDPSIGMRVTAAETPVRDALFVYSFWQQYAQTASSSSDEKGSQEEYMWEIQMEGTHEKLDHARLWLDGETGNPKRMEVYDRENQVSIQMEYLDFQPNVDLDPSVFTIT